MINRKLAFAWLCAMLQAGCGGGGGGGPAPAPSPAPSALPSIDATALRLAELPGSCGSPFCIVPRHLTIEPNGEFTAFWVESVAGGASTLRGANAQLVTPAVLSRALVEPSFAEVRLAFERVSSRGFVYLNDAGPPSPAGQTQSRLITFAGAGQATMTAVTNTPQTEYDLSHPIVRDAQGRLHAIGLNTLAPFPSTTLAGGIELVRVTPAPAPFATLDAQSVAEFDSMAPLALWTVLGKPSASDDPGVYFNLLSLTDGKFSPAGFTKTSTQPVRMTGPTGRFCGGPSIKSIASAEFAIYWHQMNAALDGCDLWVNGVRVNGGALDVVESAVSGRANNVLVALWREAQAPPGTLSRLRFSRLDAGAASWTAPAAIDSALDSAEVRTVVPPVAGPGGTLALVWDFTCNVADPACKPARLVSKYVSGVWTTKSIGRLNTIQGLAINANGEGVLLGVGSDCNGATCTELSAYRF